jgi:hypothetical protein
MKQFDQKIKRKSLDIQAKKKSKLPIETNNSDNQNTSTHNV